jgi:hypothetical protein
MELLALGNWQEAVTPHLIKLQAETRAANITHSMCSVNVQTQKQTVRMKPGTGQSGCLQKEMEDQAEKEGDPLPEPAHIPGYILTLPDFPWLFSCS